MRRPFCCVVAAVACAPPSPADPSAGSSGSDATSSTSSAAQDVEGSTTLTTEATTTTDAVDDDATGSSSGSADGSTGPPSCVVDPDDAPTCSSGVLWIDGDRPSTLMRPGAACNDCHRAIGGAPVFAVAGTVYPTLHEPDDCYGASGAMGGVFVRIMGSDGASLDVPVNSSGNFFASTSAGIVFPVFTEVVTPAGVRSMCGWQQDGDCNACHTEDGMGGAPGRIRLP